MRLLNLFHERTRYRPDPWERELEITCAMIWLYIKTGETLHLSEPWGGSNDWQSTFFRCFVFQTFFPHFWFYVSTKGFCFSAFQQRSTLLIVICTNLFTWTSAASPGAAPSRSEAFRFSSWKKKFWLSVFCPQTHFSWHRSEKISITTHLFQEVPGFLCEVRRKAEFAFQDFVNRLFSVFTSERRLGKQRRKLSLVSSKSMCVTSAEL